ncbi:DNA-directed RNA polymerase III subunit rpc25 [Lignoscripta atroalba]|nr:DNA-directed RNA polymerase III subunit rpc25 [Lignoscripta atroalba]
MFILTTISDLVQISPEDFQKPSAEAIEDNINAKYANKVIQKIGLCICVYDILKASDGLIGHGTGIVNVNVRLDFFDDITVPQQLMFPESTFNIAEQCWVWKNEGQEYFYDKHEWVRVRVEQEHWHDQSPVAPSEREAMSAQERKSPYSITVRGFTPGKEKLELTVIGIDDAVGIGSY